jgi:hypothetical protein
VEEDDDSLDQLFREVEEDHEARNRFLRERDEDEKFCYNNRFIRRTTRAPWVNMIRDQINQMDNEIYGHALSWSIKTPTEKMKRLTTYHNTASTYMTLALQESEDQIDKPFVLRFTILQEKIKCVNYLLEYIGKLMNQGSFHDDYMDDRSHEGYVNEALENLNRGLERLGANYLE